MDEQPDLPEKSESGWQLLLDQLCSESTGSTKISVSMAEYQPSYQELAASYDCTLLAIAAALDQRELAQEKHTLRLTEYTVEATRRLALPEFEAIHVRRGALLHDIGNLFIPEEVLLKKGPLSQSEWKLVRLHPVYAYRLLSPIPLLQRALDIPYSHHEHWDGSGYPLGLVGDAIPLTARIFTIIDAWEALTHERPYRHALTGLQALDLIVKLSGIWFDPALVPVVATMLHEEILENTGRV